MKTKTITTFYCAQIPTGTITALTPEDAKAAIDEYLNGECDEYYYSANGGYKVVTDDVIIYKYTRSGAVPAFKRRFFYNGYDRERDQLPEPDIDYGVLGFFAGWEDVNDD